MKPADFIRSNFGEWWEARSIEAHDTLDELARQASLDPDAMELLLFLIDAHGIARSALHRVLINAQDIEDAEQAVMAAVAFKVGQFEGRSRFSTWLTQVARNEAKMLLRSRSRRPADLVADPEPSPFLARLSTLVADRDVVHRALDQLDEHHRRPIELREIDGLDYMEIARVLDIPLGTVRSRLSRARAMLVEALDPDPYR